MFLMLVNRSWFGFENHFILLVYNLFLDIHLHVKALKLPNEFGSNSVS